MILKPATNKETIPSASMIEFLQALRDVPLLRFALYAGLISSVTFGVVGSFVVARRIGYIAAGIAHSILGGIGASYYLARTYGWESWCTPMLGAVIAALASAAIIGWVSLRVKEREDTIIGAIWAFGMAVGLLFIFFTPGKAVNLDSFIFGNILFTSRGDVIATVILGAIVLTLIALFYHKLVAVCFDEEFARLRGISSKAYYLLLLGITAISMVLLVRLAGIILSLALIVLPAATASKISKRLWTIMVIATGLSMIYNVYGLALSYQLEVPTGPLIVVMGSIVYGFSFLLTRKSLGPQLERLKQWINHLKGKFSNLFITLFLSIFGLSLTVAGAREPNFVFIIADDLGWGDVDFHGGNVPTPNLAKLLAEGTELKQHYVAPVCSPTRAGLMTGRYWSRFGITTPTNNLALPFGTITLPMALREAGYQTAITGKWHLGSKPEWGPNHFGFEYSYGSLAGGVTPWSHFYKKGPYTETWHRNENLLKEEGHVTDLLTAVAIGWLQKRDPEKPFFLYVPFTAVHLPIREPENWLAKVPDTITGEVPRQYAASILHLDDSVGRIVNAVDSAALKEKTLIVFTSDNGGSTTQNNDAKYPDDQCPNGALPGNNLPYRGQKGTLYEGGTRVPTIARWPGKIPAGTSCDTPVNIVDWMPTFLSLAGYQADTACLKWDGSNIWPLLEGTGQLPQRRLYSAGPNFQSSSLREGDWKLIASKTKNTNSERFELFNLGQDPSEKNDLSQTMPNKVIELHEKLKAAAVSDNDSIASP